MAFSVRACEEDEALEYLRDPSVRKFLSFDPVGVNAEWIKLVMNERLLVLTKPDWKEIEVHVACKFRDRGIVRQTMKDGLEWLHQDFEIVWTTAPDSRVGLVRMLESLDFRRVGSRWEHGN
jgi:hypothetical protein